MLGRGPLRSELVRGGAELRGVAVEVVRQQDHVRPGRHLGNYLDLDENIKLLITWYPSMQVWVVPPSLRDMTGMLG